MSWKGLEVFGSYNWEGGDAKCVQKRGQSRTVEAGNTLAMLGEEESPQPALELPCCGQKQGVREVEEDDTALI